MTDTIVTVQPQIQTLTTTGKQILLANVSAIQIMTAGTQGPAGQGVPAGGASGQLLKKNSAADFDTAWGMAKSSVIDLDNAAVSATSYTLSESDNGKILKFTAATAITLTCPNNLAAGFNIGIIQFAAGAVTPTAASGAAIYNRSSNTKTAGQYAACSLLVIENAGSAAKYIFGGDTA